jgi:transcription elongation factor GreA
MNTRLYLQQEIEKLKHELSVIIPQEIQDAVMLGDLKENSEYSAVIARQHFIGIRLEQLVKRVEAYDSIDFTLLPKDAVNVGSIVKLRDLQTNKIVYVKVVIGDINDDEGEVVEITIASPFGQAIKNKKVKDEITVHLPQGYAKYRVLHIKTIHDV